MILTNANEGSFDSRLSVQIRQGKRFLSDTEFMGCLHVLPSFVFADLASDQRRNFDNNFRRPLHESGLHKKC